MLTVLFLYALAASSFTIAKAVLLYCSPIFFIGARMTTAGLIMAGYYYLRHKRFFVIKREDFFDFGIIACVHIYLAFVLDLLALQNMNSSKGALIYNLSPFVTAVFSYFILKEKMTLKKYIGFAIGLLGILPEILWGSSTETMISGSTSISWSEISMIGSMIASSLGWTVFKKVAHKGYSLLTINGMGMLYGGILALITSCIFENNSWNPLPVTNAWAFLGLTTLIIIVTNFLFYTLYGQLLKKYSATFLSFAGFITPFLTALFGWLFLQETIDQQFIFSLVAIALGLTIFYSEELKQGYIKK